MCRAWSAQGGKHPSHLTTGIHVASCTRVEQRVAAMRLPPRPARMAPEPHLRLAAAPDLTHKVRNTSCTKRIATGLGHGMAYPASGALHFGLAAASCA